MTSSVTYRVTSCTALSVNEFQVHVTVLFSQKSKVILRDVILVLSGSVLEHQKSCNQPTESSFSRIIPTLIPKGNYFEGDNVHFSLNNINIFTKQLSLLFRHTLYTILVYIYIGIN